MFYTLLEAHVLKIMKCLHKFANLKSAAVIVHNYLVLTRNKVSKD